MLCPRAVLLILTFSCLLQDEFMENLATAAGKLQAAIPVMLDFLDGKTTEDL